MMKDFNLPSPYALFMVWTQSAHPPIKGNPRTPSIPTPLFIAEHETSCIARFVTFTLEKLLQDFNMLLKCFLFLFHFQNHIHKQ